MTLYISMVSIAPSFLFLIFLFWTSIFLFLDKCGLSVLFIFLRNHLIFAHLFKCFLSVSHLVACCLALTCLCFFFFFFWYFISSLIVLYWKKSLIWIQLFSNLLRFVLWPTMWFTLGSIYINFSLFNVLFRARYSLLSVWMICQLLWVEHTSLLLLSHYLLPVYSFMSVNICFTNWDTPMFNE